MLGNGVMVTPPLPFHLVIHFIFLLIVSNEKQSSNNNGEVKLVWHAVQIADTRPVFGFN